MSYIIEDLFPRRALHIVAGASGAGKSIWLLDTLTAWARGRPVLGCISHPEPWIYIAGDRSLEDVERKLDSLEIPRSEVVVLAAYATGRDTLDWEKVFNTAIGTGAKTLVWEGFGRYVRDNAGGRVVDAWIEQVTYQAQLHDVTVIGVTEQPKMKPRDKYPNPRQRISGPAAWGHHTSTVVLIEQLDEKTPSNPHRIIYVMVHDGGPPREFKATFVGNHLILD